MTTNYKIKSSAIRAAKRAVSRAGFSPKADENYRIEQVGEEWTYRLIGEAVPVEVVTEDLTEEVTNALTDEEENPDAALDSALDELQETDPEAVPEKNAEEPLFTAFGEKDAVEKAAEEKLPKKPGRKFSVPTIEKTVQAFRTALWHKQDEKKTELANRYVRLAHGYYGQVQKNVEEAESPAEGAIESMAKIMRFLNAAVATIENDWQQDEDLQLAAVALGHTMNRKKSGPPKGKVFLDRSAVGGACALVWQISDELCAEMGMCRELRQAVVNKAIDQGVATHTARTQYQRWRANRLQGQAA